MPTLPRWLLAALTSLPLLVPIAPYPRAAPMPAQGSILPAFVDDDEKVLVRLAPDGKVASIRDELLIQVQGSGDYVLVLPGLVEAVTNHGGDSLPGFQNGHVRFMGHLEGRKVLFAEARLDPQRYTPQLPIEITVTYFQGSTQVEPGAATGHAGTFREHIRLRNLTAKPTTFATGKPDPGVLAQLLDALRGVPSIYTPEIDLGAVYPLPASLPLAPVTASVGSVDKTVFVPLRTNVTVQLDSHTSLLAAGGAAVTQDARGTRLKWDMRLPADTNSGGEMALDFRFRTDQFRTPALDLGVGVLPLPASVFTPPGARDWAGYLSTADPGSLDALAVKAQAGAASLNRIGDIAPPVSRPGQGPERVAYDFTIDSGAVRSPTTPPLAPLRPQAWALALAFVAVVVLGANAWWAWSRH